MVDHETNLKNAVEIQKNLINEINELNNTLSLKKELAIKYQGVIEYLTGSGFTLPESEENPEETDVAEEE